MFGFTFMKADPTVYILHYQFGSIRHEGAGASFWYFAPASVIVAIPVKTMDQPFAFTETTADFQTVTLQGQLSYRIREPKRLAGLLNFTVRPEGGYVSDDPVKLAERLVGHLHASAQAAVQAMPLAEALKSTETVSRIVRDRILTSDLLTLHGIEVMSLAVYSIKPTPETAKALEAEAREAVLRRADEAIYARRNAAVEQERMIKENELNTDLAVQEKNRQIKEAKINADIALEEKRLKADLAHQQERTRADVALEQERMQASVALEAERTKLIEEKIVNDRKDIEVRALAAEAAVKPLRDLDWRALMALGKGGLDSGTMIAMAFKDLAENAQKVGQLNITPDLLEGLLAHKRER